MEVVGWRSARPSRSTTACGPGTVFTKQEERLLAGDVASCFLARLIAKGLYNSGSMGAVNLTKAGRS